MKAGWVLGAATLASVLALSDAAARAEDDTKAELEKYKQRTEALEKKVEQIEAMEAQKGGTTEEQIRKAAEKLAGEKGAPSDFRVYWKDHLRLETNDQTIKMGIGARMNMDAASINGNNDLNKSIGKQTDGTELRRFRLHLYGSFYDDVFFKLQPDFSVRDTAEQSTTAGTAPVANKGLTVALKDVYVGFNNLIPYATLRVGHYQEPFNLEEIANDQDYTFMERGLPDVFAPSYQIGVMAYHPILDQRMTWWLGMFRPTDTPENTAGGSGNAGYSQFDGGYDITGRVTGLPWYEDNGNELLHLGVSTSLRDPKSPVEFKSAPESHLATAFVDTGKLAATQVELVNGEILLIQGPLSFQSELDAVQVERSDGSANNNFTSGYVLASYMLTGEHRGYDRSVGYIDRLIPFNNYGQYKDGVKGWGAWEVAARYSWLDLNSVSVHGGRLDDFTLGLNWYLNPNVRFMLNYTLADLSDATGAKSPNKGLCNIFGIRLGMDY